MIESAAASVTYLFSDIEGSTRLWEADPGCAARTVAWHDEVSRSAVERHRGTIVKTTGDGVHAAFEDPADAVAAVIDLQLALAEPGAERAPLKVRCGLHLGADQRRDNDFYGPAVNRAARIMSAAHGGQVLVSGAVAERVSGRLPGEVVLRDLGTVRLRDLGSPEHVFQLVHPRLRSEFPPLRSMATTPNNLAQQLNSFVGRDREMEQVRQLLASSRLLTLLGMGGLGKSRLSMQVAAIVLEDYPDGVWFVEFAAFSDPQLVPQAVATVLGVKEEPGRPVLDALISYVRDKKMLLVFDNCEHLVHKCAELAKRLLQAGAGVKVLASSRDPLRIAGESLYPLTPLPAPGKDAARCPAEHLLVVDSVRLFVERARSIQPAFRLDDRSVRAIAEICRRLDGIPLALELAAARVRAMAVDQIAARLDDRFRLLNRGDRTALPRQQTLRALIDWSHDLLESNERIVFRRLAVFAGGWTMEAAEDVVVGGTVEPADVLDLLSNLVEKSLVVAHADGGRYDMLDTVRQYALEQLCQSGEEVSTRERHLAYFTSLAERSAPRLAGSEQAVALHRLEAEEENVLCAHAFCVGSKCDAEQACRLVLAVKHYLFMRGQFALGYQLVNASISMDQAADSPRRCEALWVAGQICSYTGRYEEAERRLNASLAIAVILGDRRMMANAENFLALTSLGVGNVPAARLHCNEALRLARELGSKPEIAVAANALAQVSRLEGDLDNAEKLYREVVALATELDIGEFIALGMLGLAMVAISRGSSTQACEMLKTALRLAIEIGSRPAELSALEVAAGLAALEGDAERFAVYFGAAQGQMLRAGIKRDPADQAFLDPLIARCRSALGETLFASAESTGRAMPFDQAIADARGWAATDRPGASRTDGRSS